MPHTPIEVLGKRKLKTITYSENKKKILSPQDYKRSWDPDMSRLSVLFYEKIYKKEMLEYGLPIDKDFLGDTMFKSNYFLVNDLKRKHPEDEKR